MRTLCTKRYVRSVIAWMLISGSVSGICHAEPRTRTYATPGKSMYREVSSGAVGGEAKIVADGGQEVSCLAWSPSENLAAWRKNDGSVMLYDAAAGKLETLAAGNNNQRWFRCPLAFSGDGKRLVGAYDSAVVIWDVAARTVLHQFRVPEDERIRQAWISPDASRLAVKVQERSDNFRIEMIDVAGKKTIGQVWYPRVEGRMENGTFAADGAQFILEIRAGDIRRLDGRTGRELPPIRLSSQGLVAMACSRDGNVLALSSSGDKLLGLWDISKAEAVPALRTSVSLGSVSGGNSSLGKVAFSPDNRSVAIYHEPHDGQWVSVCDVASGRRRFSLKAEEVGPFSSDGRFLVTGAFGPKETLYVWDAATGEQVRALPGEKQRLAAFSTDGKYLLTAGDGIPVRLWPLTIPTQSLQVAELRSAATDRRFRQIGRVLFSPDSASLVVMGYSDGDGGSIFSVATGAEKCLMELPAHNTSPMAMALSGGPGPDRVVAVGLRFETHSRGIISQWDLRTGRGLTETRMDPPPQVASTHTLRPRSVAVSPDGRWIAAGGTIPFSKPVVCVFAQPSLRLVHAFCDLPGEAQTLRFSADGNSLAALISYPNQVFVWDLATKNSKVLPIEHKGVFEFLENGSIIWCLTPRDRLQRWNVTTGQLENEISDKDMVSPHGIRFERLALSPAGNAFATGDDRGVVLVREPTHGRTLHTLNGHRAPIKAIAFSPDGCTLATGDEKGQARLWKLGSPRVSAPPVAEDVKRPDVAAERGRADRIPAIVPSVTFNVEGGAKAVYPREASMTFSNDSSRLLLYPGEISGSAGVQVWDVATRAKLCSVKGFRVFSPMAAAASIDGRSVVGTFKFPTDDGSRTLECAALLDTASGRTEKLPLKMWGERTRLVGTGLVSGTLKGDLGRLVLANTSTGQILKEANCYEIQGVTRSPDGRWLAVVEGEDEPNRIVSLFDSQTLERKGQWKSRIERRDTLFAADSGGMLVKGENKICMLSVPGLRERWSLQHHSFSDAQDIRDGCLLDTFKDVSLVDLGSGITRRTITLADLRQAVQTQIGGKRIRPPLALMGGNSMLVLADDNRLTLFDPASGRLGKSTASVPGEIGLVAIAPNRDYVAILGETREGWLVQVFRVTAGAN